MVDIVKQLEKEIKDLNLSAQAENIGRIMEIGDGIAKIEGISNVAYNELVQLPHNSYG